MEDWCIRWNKMEFLLSCGCANTTVSTRNTDANKRHEKKKTSRELYKNATNYFEQILQAITHKTTAVRPLTSHLKKHPSKMNKTRQALLEKKERTYKWLSFNRTLHMDMSVFTDQQELIYISSVWMQDAVWKTCLERGMIRMESERKREREREKERAKSVSLVQIDDSDDDNDFAWKKDERWYN